MAWEYERQIRKMKKKLILLCLTIAILIFTAACSGEDTSSTDNVLGKWQACGCIDDGEKCYYDELGFDEPFDYIVEFKGEHEAIYTIGGKTVDVECEKVSDDEYILQIPGAGDEFIEISFTYDGEHLIAYCEAEDESECIYERVE